MVRHSGLYHTFVAHGGHKGSFFHIVALSPPTNPSVHEYTSFATSTLHNATLLYASLRTSLSYATLSYTTLSFALTTLESTLTLLNMKQPLLIVGWVGGFFLVEGDDWL